MRDVVYAEYGYIVGDCVVHMCGDGFFCISYLSKIPAVDEGATTATTRRCEYLFLRSRVFVCLCVWVGDLVVFVCKKLYRVGLMITTVRAYCIRKI